MRSIKHILLSSVTAACAFGLIAAQDNAPKEQDNTPLESEAQSLDSLRLQNWDITSPSGSARVVDINTDQGSWMNLDVSPDGTIIVFDLLGDIYTMPVTGGNAVNIASGLAWDTQPRFSVDGSKIAFTSDRSGKANIWTVKLDGSNLTQITDETKTSGADPVWRSPSEDEGLSAYAETKSGKSVLVIKDLETGDTETVFKELDQIGEKDSYPNMAWGPNNESLYFWAKGQIQRLDVESQDVTTVPFQITDTRLITQAQPPFTQIAPADIQLKTPRFAQMSPDGKTIVFESLGKLYLRDVETQKVWNLTTLPRAERELYPSWAPDSQSLLFTTWTDDEFGAVHSIDLIDRDITTHTEKAGLYIRPILSPSGEFFLYETRAGGNGLPSIDGAKTGIYIQAIGSSDSILISKSGTHPHFSEDERRIYFTQNKDSNAKLVSVNLLAEDKQTHASLNLRSKTAKTSFHISPDAGHIAILDNDNLYLSPAAPDGEILKVKLRKSTYPLASLGGGVSFPKWTQTPENDAELSWTQGAALKSASPAQVFSQDFTATDAGISLSYKTKAAQAASTIALTNARIITMNSPDGGVIESGNILIQGNRILDIGETIYIPEGVTTVDLQGKTIMPGLINAAGRLKHSSGDLIAQQDWRALDTLSRGVTTLLDISATPEQTLAVSEMQQAGLVLSPRLLSARKISAKSDIGSLRTQGMSAAIISGNKDRRQQQYTLNAASNNGLAAMTKTRGAYQKDMRLIQDGAHIIRKAKPAYTLYEDAQQMLSASVSTYIPAMSYSSENKDEEGANMHARSKHVPPKHVPSKSGNKSKSSKKLNLREKLKLPKTRKTKKDAAKGSDSETQMAASIAYIESLIDSGGDIIIGARGHKKAPIANLHRAIWNYKQSGVSNLGALQAVTTLPAKHMGLDNDIGSLEAGKLADLIVLSGSPLESIRDLATLEHVMIGGRLYEAETMNEVHTGDSHRLPYWWEEE